MKSDHVLCLSSKGFHRMHYVEWGEPDAERIVICVHGLTRNCRDFDFLAQALLPEFRVVCPDVAGRGQSDWLPAKEDYAYPQYCADMTALIARVTAGGKPRRIYWVGTSMGGIFGMLLASRPNTPIARLVVNDVGTFIPKAAQERIGTYLGRDPRFKTLEELETMVRFVSAPFGPLTEAQWRHLTVTGAKQHADGSWGLRYDPGIVIPLQKQPLADVDLWQYLGHHRLSHAAAARQAVRPAVEGNRDRHDPARPAAEAGRIRGHRARADVDGGRSDQGGAGVPARGIVRQLPRFFAGTDERVNPTEEEVS